MALVSLSNNFYPVGSVDSYFDGIWHQATMMTNPGIIQDAPMVLLKNGLLYDRDNDKWQDTFEDSKPVEIKKQEVPFKFREKELLEEFSNYVASTYAGHYVGEDNVQSLDLIFAIGHGEGFCTGSGLKYLARSGKKAGQHRQDLMKTLHYALLLLYLYDRAEERRKTK
ncbi:MAG: DUF3310 domain-containing protein [Candidatus Bathyarchaeia archaeon]